MHLEVGDLESFYATPMGLSARRAILRRIKLLWPEVKALRVLGFGFAIPYLAPWLQEAERIAAFMPSQEGVLAWPHSKNLAVLGDESGLPFSDSLFDRILVIHGLEGAESVRPLLRQLWRVLAPEGRLLVVAPNRASPWTTFARSPFALGRPYHRLELAELLKSALFEPLAWDRALHVPPVRSRKLIGTGTTWENVGRRGWPALAGVHLVEASKSLVAPLVETARARGNTQVRQAGARSFRETVD